MISLLLPLIYLTFISLGLPDAVLGSAWPVISNEFSVSISNMGIVTIIISAGTIFSSLNSDRLIHKLGVHKITAMSVFSTAISLFAFSQTNSFLALCLCAIPYGLGAGSVDAALNNYVAVNYESKHMSWLHCMWGVGATLGPYIMGAVLTAGTSFRLGYIILFVIQIILSIVIIISKPIWKNKIETISANENYKVLSLKEIFKLPGVPFIAVAFFCFCAAESTAGFWASSYLVYNRGIAPEIATSFASLFYLGITIGRGICGFIAIKFHDREMIRAGAFLMLIGILILFIPTYEITAFLGIAIIGLGSAPIFPCIIHSTPENFGVKNSQAVTGVQMASAYTGTLAMPALFGIIGNSIDFSLYPVYLGIIILTMLIMYEITLKKVRNIEIS